MTSFDIDFSGRTWLVGKGLDIGSVLSAKDTLVLLSTLEMDNFLKLTDQCDRRSSKFMPNIHGWKNGLYYI